MKSGAISLRRFSFPPPQKKKECEKAIWRFRHDNLSDINPFLDFFSLLRVFSLSRNPNRLPFKLIFTFFFALLSFYFSHAFRLSIVSCLALSDGLLFHGRGLFSRGTALIRTGISVFRDINR